MTDEQRPAPESPAAPAKKKRSALFVRLPLILSVVFGLWIWRGGGGLVIAERELVFQMPADRADLKRFEFQLYEGEALIKRGEYSFTSMGAPADLRSKIQLKQGAYPVKLFSWYGSEPKAVIQEVRVADEEQVVVDVPAK